MTAARTALVIGAGIAGPIARALRDATLPAIMKMAANSKQATAAYRYHIDWNAAITA